MTNYNDLNMFIMCAVFCSPYMLEFIVSYR